MVVVDNIASPTNKGLKERAELFSENKVTEMLGCYQHYLTFLKNNGNTDK